MRQKKQHACDDMLFFYNLEGYLFYYHLPGDNIF